MSKELCRSFNKKSRLMRGFLLVAVLAVLLASCSGEKSDLVTLAGEAQGSTFSIKYRDPQQRDLSMLVDSTLKVIDQSLSLWVEGSTVNAFNQADTTFTSKDSHFRIMVARSEQLWNETEGAFDPTVLPLVKAWGLGKEGREALDTLAVDSIRRFVGMDRMAMDEDWRERPVTPPVITYRKTYPEVNFDPNGIAQGYTVDVLAQLLEAHGISDYMVEVGGEVRARGLNDRGKVWTIQIDKQVEGEQHVEQIVVPLADRSLATSGNYRKFIEVEGKRYGHTIDPRTGRPAMNSLLSASIIADDCATADALATAMLVLGLAEAQLWLRHNRGVEAYLIMDEGQGDYTVWSTPGWPVLEAQPISPK
ncbi:MAG: FAD:protein FMN transferase [Flavobacteriales bacterium]